VSGVQVLILVRADAEAVRPDERPRGRRCGGENAGA